MFFFYLTEMKKIYITKAWFLQQRNMLFFIISRPRHIKNAMQQAGAIC
jgi:hypothetical protein